MQTHIAGIPHRKPDLGKLKVGDIVQLFRELDNKFDPNAVKVLHNNVHLGYIPKDKTGFVKPEEAVFYITEIDPSRKWSEVIISTERPLPKEQFDIGLVEAMQRDKADLS